MTDAVGPGPGRTSPVFIVGLPRSGTTLMAVCLDRHPMFDCGPETHLFPRLAKADGIAALEPAGWPGIATDMLCGLSTDGILVHRSAGLSRQRIEDWLAGRPPSIAAMLEALVATQASDAGKPRWIEKTPRHMDYVRLIRASWPDASIIHMVRDPRARAMSMARVPFGTASILANLREGARRDARARLSLEQDPHTIAIRLEDLVDDPERELTRVCRFLGEAYTGDMLEPSEAPTAIGPHEWWKQRASRAIEPSVQESWHDAMNPAVQRFAAMYCADQIRRDGYPDPRTPRHTLVIVPIGADIIDTQEPFALALADAGVVVSDVPTDHRSWLRGADLVAFWGRPGQLLPDAGNGWRALGGMVIDLAVRRVRRRPAWWVAERTPRARQDSARERWFSRVLRVLAHRGTKDELVNSIVRESGTAESATQGSR